MSAQEAVEMVSICCPKCGKAFALEKKLSRYRGVRIPIKVKCSCGNKYTVQT